MNRVINELSSDEVKQTGGYKVGDFGQGGREYVRYERRAHYEPGQGASKGVGKVVLGIAALAVAGLVVYAERENFLAIGLLPEASRAYSYGDVAKADWNRNNALVHFRSSLANPPVLERGVDVLRDPFFGFEVPNENKDVVLKRNTEYCQWVEVPQHRQEKIGQDPDYCAKSSSDEACANTDCSGYRSQGQCGSTRANCCSWRRGADIYKTTTTYLYHKGWRNSRISSLLFDNPVAYHNPQRDPAPSTIFKTQAKVDLSGGQYGSNEALMVQSTDLESIFTPMRQEPLFKQHADNLATQALANGFSETSNQHFYSRKPADGWDSPGLLQAAGAYLIDGVVDVNSLSKASGLEGLLGAAGLDWLTKGTCEAGDVRVSFSTQSLPRELSLVGEQRSPNLITTHAYANGKNVMLKEPVSLELSALIETIKKNQEYYTNLWRLGAFVLAAVGAYAGQTEVFGTSSIPSLAIIAVTLFTTSENLSWLWLYRLNWTPIGGVFVLAMLVGGYLTYTLKPVDGGAVKAKSL